MNIKISTLVPLVLVILAVVVIITVYIYIKIDLKKYNIRLFAINVIIAIIIRRY